MCPIDKPLIFVMDSGSGNSGPSHFAKTLSPGLADFFKIQYVTDYASDDNFATAISLVPNNIKNIKNALIRGIIKLLLYLPSFVKLVKRANPVLIMSLNPYDYIVSILSNIICKKKLVIGIRGTIGYAESTSHLSNYFGRLSLKICKLSKHTYYIPVSNHLETMLTEKYHINSNKISVIYNSLDLNELKVKAEETLISPEICSNIPTLVTVGRLHPNKGYGHLLRIFENLREKYPCKLVICGMDICKKGYNEKYYEYIHSLLSSMKYKNDVIFTGRVENPYKYMKKGDVFVFPSITEGFPNALLEALGCGCPVVAANCVGAIKELLGDNKYGFVSNPLDSIHYPLSSPLTSAELDMLEKIILLLENFDLRDRYSELALSRAKDFERGIIMGEYHKVFSKIIESSSLK